MLLLLGLSYCHKEDNNGYKSHGKITGPDIRLCACCGGWYIDIDSTTYEFDSLPDKTINLQKDTFPIYVKLDWKLSDKIACPNRRITIQKIIKE